MCGKCGNATCINGKQFIIRGKFVGIHHLYDIYEELIERRETPDNITGDELLRVVSSRNYIPDGLENEYIRVLMKEFEMYYRRLMDKI